jgi:hypothetical protein
MSEKKHTGNDEIDLVDVFRRMGRSIGKGIKAIGRWIMISIVFIIRNWLVLGMSIILGIVLAFVLKSISGSFYTSDMTIKANAAPASDMISYINRLHNFCTEGNKTGLQSAMSVSKEISDEILDIQAFWIIDQNKDRIPDFVDYRNNHSVYDTVNIRMPDRFDVRIKVSSISSIEKIGKGIIDYLARDTLFNQKNRIRLQQNEELTRRVETDIFLLDSLQKIKYFEETKSRQPLNGGQMIFLQEQKTQLLYKDIQDLFNTKQALESERLLYGNIATVLSNLSLPAVRENGTSFYLVRTVPLMFLLALIVLVLQQNRKTLREIMKKY